MDRDIVWIRALFMAASIAVVLEATLFFSVSSRLVKRIVALLDRHGGFSNRLDQHYVVVRVLLVLQAVGMWWIAQLL